VGFLFDRSRRKAVSEPTRKDKNNIKTRGCSLKTGHVRLDILLILIAEAPEANFEQ
jgi:hypothetical protein